MRRAAQPSSRTDWLPYLGGAALICLIILMLTALTLWQGALRSQHIVGSSTHRIAPDWSAGDFVLLGFSGLMILATLGGAWQLFRLAQQRARSYAEQKAEVILESSPLAIVLVDTDNVVRRANQAATELFGYPIATMIGMPGDRLVAARHHALQRELVEQFLRPCTPHARRTCVEIVGLNSGGNEMPLQVSLSTIDTDGMRHGILVLEDLTVRRHAESSLRELLSLQTAILTHSPYAILTTRPNGTLTLFNPAAERMLGYRANEVVGRHTPALFHDGTLHAPELSEASALPREENEYDFDALMAEVRKTSPLAGQASYRRKDGSHFTVSRSISALLDDDGRITGYLCILADITEQLANEKLIQLTLERLRMATQLADIGIWSWDLADNRLHWDDLICQWYQVPQEVRDGGITYDYWRSRAHPDDIAPLEAAIAETLRTAEPGGGSFRVLQADGSVRYYESLWVVERDESGQVMTLLGVNQDVTTQREYDTGLRTAKEAAEAANQAKSDFLANISHEIRTPMNAIIGLTGLTLQTELNARQRDYLDKVHNSSTVLLQLLNDILDYAKIEAGHLAIEKQPFELAEVVHRVAGLFAHSLEARHVSWRLDLDPALPHHLCGDALRLGQVLTNLVGNAVKFTPQGEVCLSLSLASETAQHVTLRGVVSDTGIGMSADDITRVFTAFAQADTSVSRQYGGTGLGLSIVRHLVGLMGGEVTVQSVPGQGSTFDFTVKLERVPDSDSLALVQPGPRLMAPTVVRTRALSDSDRARLDALLQKLAQLLSAHRLTAKRVNEDIESLLDGTTYTEAFQPVAHTVRQLKFTDAQEALKTFRAALAASS